MHGMKTGHEYKDPFPFKVVETVAEYRAGVVTVVVDERSSRAAAEEAVRRLEEASCTGRYFVTPGATAATGPRLGAK